MNGWLRGALKIISILLLGWLVYNLCGGITIASTKNVHLIATKKMEIDQLQNINSVKKLAKETLDQIHAHQLVESNHASLNLFLLLFLTIVQIFQFKLISLKTKSINGQENADEL